MADKNLNGNGLNEVWIRAAQLVKKYTGAVDLTKGNLQTQVDTKITGTDDTKDNVITFTSSDELNPSAWKDVTTLESKEKHLSLFNKISTMFSNIRFLYKNVGGIKGLSSSAAITTEGEYALDAREKNASVEGTLANQLDVLNSNFDTKADKTQISNPNLFDNPWFNVNSRGQNEYANTSYTVDRWKWVNPRTWAIATVTDEGLVLDTTSAVNATDYMDQIFEIPFEVGQLYTVSIILDNEIYTKVMTQNSTWTIIPNDDINWFTFTIYGQSIRIGNKGKHTIKAIKLEKGSVSTLHMDTAPDIEQERLKCMLSTADSTDTYANKGALSEDLWNSTKTYVVGSYCIWLGTLWKCLAENSGVVPVEGDTWTATNIGAELASLQSKIDALSA